MDPPFRKIDIDKYDEEVLNDEDLYDPDPRDPGQVLEEARQRQVAVRSSLAKNDTAGALSIILDNAPYGQNVDEAKAGTLSHFISNHTLTINLIKEITLSTLLTILNSTKATELTPVIKSLSPDAQDTLMKYIYKGMAMPGWGDISGSVLLGWHEKLTEVAGVGSIVRAMTDRRVV